MGNCAFRGNGAPADSSMIRVVTPSGGVLELQPPVTAECVTSEFPSHGIFGSHDALSRPLLHNEELISGQSYHLCPLNSHDLSIVPSAAAPYRVSFDQHGFWRRQDVEVLPIQNSGIWKVKLVIKPDQLAEILSQESRTEALIESVRAVVKCGSGSTASVATSDLWSLSSSKKATSDNNIVMD
ncbi:uncharacterized protein M6B38_413630 [Iris pallida]|uniref:Uncharacterized protein n=1 Tax=Iris pallida TaxID=29817 RepID=A0AAX6FKS6_IRIPA|nr:uncharacterized protein M6B38_413630 [Iris pallida]